MEGFTNPQDHTARKYQSKFQSRSFNNLSALNRKEDEDFKRIPLGSYNKEQNKPSINTGLLIIPLKLAKLKNKKKKKKIPD